jgi:hypothetical protein
MEKGDQGVHMGSSMFLHSSGHAGGNVQERQGEVLILGP